MNTIKAVILDDEPHGREIVCHLFTKNFPGIEIEARCQNLEQLTRVYQTAQPRILFMDVRLGESKSLEINGHICLSNTALIFVTGYPQYALEAFRLNAVDYLLKPVQEAELVAAVHKAFDRLRTGLQKASIIIKSVHGYEMVEIQQIAFAESQSNYTVFHMDDGRKIVSSKTLKLFTRVLESNGFSRVHRSYFVNTGKIREYNTVNRILVLAGNQKIEVAKSHHAELLAFFKRNDAY